MRRKDKYELSFINLHIIEDKELDEVTVEVLYNYNKVGEYTCHNCSTCIAIHLLRWLDEIEEED